MARTLAFSHRGEAFHGEIDKVDRAKLYGAVTIETNDVDGRPCRLMSLASDGRTLIPRGGTALAYFDEHERWLERDQLKPVDARGFALNPVASSFSHVIDLDVETSVNRFLDHTVRLAYALAPAEAEAWPSTFAEALTQGTIFKFDFSYRGGVRADPAFICQAADGLAWLLIGDESRIDWVTYEQATGLIDDDDDEGAADDDDFDFDMM
ncbi:MAG: hypothetical protein AAFR04_07990 [Pseudomonadota bacterium]